MSTTFKKIDDNQFLLQFVTTQYDSPTAVFSNVPFYRNDDIKVPSCRMCIRTITGNDKKKKLAVFLFYGAHGQALENSDVTAVLNLKRANGITGETITMHNIYYLESYAYGFACFLDVLQLKSQGYIEDGQITLECHVRIESTCGVKMKKSHNFEIYDPVLSDVVLHVDGKKFYANKKFLSSRSSRFFGNATNDNRCIGLIFDHLEHEEFEKFLQCMYSSANIDNSNVKSVLSLAKRFLVYGLIDQCEKFLGSKADKIPMEYAWISRYTKRPVPMKDPDWKGNAEKAKLGKSVHNPFEFDDATVVALLKRMQENIRSSSQQLQTHSFETKYPVLCDIVLIVEGKKFYVNKKLLSNYSAVFRALFSRINYSYDCGYGSFSEYTNDNITYMAFKKFLQCLNLERNVDKTNYISVLEMAKRFEVNHLIDKCEKFLVLRDDLNKSKKLELSEKYELPNLQAAVLNSIKDSAELETLTSNTEGFSDALLKKLREITI